MQLQEILNSLNERVSTLEDQVNNTLIGGLKSAAAEYADNEHFENFSGKYGPALEEFSPKMKILCGEDYDLVREIYEALKEADGYGTDGFDEDGLMNAKLAELKEKFDAMKDTKEPEVVEETVVEEVPAKEEFPNEDELLKEAKQVLGK